MKPLTKPGALSVKSRERPAEMRKRKKKTLDVGKEARRAARNSGLAPSATRVVEDKRKNPAKHKKNWLNESDA